MKSLRDYLNTTVSGLAAFVNDDGSISEAENLLRAAPEQTQLPTIFATRGEAHETFRLANIERGPRKAVTIGGRYTHRRSHIAYAMGRKIVHRLRHNGLMPVEGAERLMVLHATKGWRVLSGVSV
jgi:hypothetical protein